MALPVARPPKFLSIRHGKMLFRCSVFPFRPNSPARFRHKTENTPRQRIYHLRQIEGRRSSLCAAERLSRARILPSQVEIARARGVLEDVQTPQRQRQRYYRLSLHIAQQHPTIISNFRTSSTSDMLLCRRSTTMSPWFRMRRSTGTGSGGRR